MYISYKEKNIKEEQRNEINKKYIKTKLIEEKNYFDNMFKKVDENIILDENQRKIILTDEKYTMVIAGAGSGKTTTITAKANYLIEKQNIKDEEIIIISFTNKAVDELKSRINDDFKHNVNVTTFHKLGYQIIKENTKKPPQIIKNDDILKECILKINKSKDNKILKYIKNIISKIKENILYEEKKQDNRELDLYKQYISLYKSKKKDNKKYNLKNNKNSNHMLEIYNAYQKKLKEINMIDFDDIINEANKIIITNKNINFKYKYIIIDEYQDISQNRYNLIKNISKITNSKIMVVGDDWQCIYSFASSDINLFTNFKNNVEYCEILKIEKTYRNSQQLIDIAGEFIQKNNNQIKKQLISDKQIEKPITLISYNNKEIKKVLIKALDYIIEKYGPYKKILILGRYKFEKKEIIDKEVVEENNSKIIYKKYPQTEIEYLTIHSSKGLGYDNVILINTKIGEFGFPSRKKTNKLLKPLIIKDNGIKNAEERRLFYVALTRTKNEILILKPKKNYSEFIKEIENKCNKI